jgi:hypothetical protein
MGPQSCGWSAADRAHLCYAADQLPRPGVNALLNSLVLFVSLRSDNMEDCLIVTYGIFAFGVCRVS